MMIRLTSIDKKIVNDDVRVFLKNKDFNTKLNINYQSWRHGILDDK